MNYKGVLLLLYFAATCEIRSEICNENNCDGICIREYAMNYVECIDTLTNETYTSIESLKIELKCISAEEFYDTYEIIGATKNIEYYKSKDNPERDH